MLRQEFATTLLSERDLGAAALRSRREEDQEIDVDDAELIGPRVLEDPEDVAAFCWWSSRGAEDFDALSDLSGVRDFGCLVGRFCALPQEVDPSGRVFITR